MDWNDNIIARYEAKARQNVQAACDLVRDRAKVNVGIQGPPRSKAGNFPHRDTSQLYRGIGSQMIDAPADQPRGVAGTNVKHGGILELTEDPQRKRPWLRRTLAESKAEIVKILSTF